MHYEEKTDLTLHRRVTGEYACGFCDRCVPHVLSSAVHWDVWLVLLLLLKHASHTCSTQMLQDTRPLNISPFCLRYGSRSVDLLKRYYQNELTDLSQDDTIPPSELNGGSDSRAESSHHTSTSGRTGRTPNPTAPESANRGSAALHDETLAPRAALPPLLLNLGERPPEALQYLGTSFGLTQQLFSFWHRSGYKPVYVRQTASDITGDHCPPLGECSCSLPRDRISVC